MGGNEKLSKAGYTIFTNALGNAGFVGAMTNGGGASILAHDSVLGRMTKDAVLTARRRRRKRSSRRARRCA